MQYTYIKTLAASIIFLALSALKLISPGFAQDIRMNITELISADTDYRGAISALGESITGPDGLLSVFKSVGNAEPADSASETTLRLDLNSLDPSNWRLFAPDKTQETAAPMESAAPTAAGAATPEPPPTATPVPTPTPEPTAPAVSSVPVFSEVQETEEPQNAVVAAFLERQSDYSDYAVPANVSYDIPALPFTYQAPVPGYTGSGFGYRMHPVDGLIKFHYGTDIPASSGDDIYAFAGGTVSFVGEEDGYGDFLILDHGNGYTTLYAHCGTIYVQMGQSVSAGDKVALVGATGKVTGPHLHFELKSGGTYLNPEFYLYAL